jgi:fatty acyl-CoA reductase
VIKAKDTEASSKRLHNEVVDTELFKCLQEIHGKDYHGFVAGKLVPVAGNVTEANLGIAPKLADEIADEVDIIVNSAASTTFDERFHDDATRPHHCCCSVVCYAQSPINHPMTIQGTALLMDGRYDVAMNLNTLGPFRLMSFAHRFRKLKLFLQVSTGQAVLPKSCAETSEYYCYIVTCAYSFKTSDQLSICFHI